MLKANFIQTNNKEWFTLYPGQMPISIPHIFNEKARKIIVGGGLFYAVGRMT